MGQRQVEAGGVQIHRRTSEMPGQADVTQRNETVKVDRRAMDRPLDANTRDTVRRTDMDVTQTGGQDMERYRTAWRGHYQTQFATSGYKYEQYEPAYEYGYSLRNEDRYRDYDWNRLEPEARRTWEQNNPGTAWDQAKAAVRYAWDSFKQAVRN